MSQEHFLSNPNPPFPENIEKHSGPWRPAAWRIALWVCTARTTATISPWCWSRNCHCAPTQGKMKIARTSVPRASDLGLDTVVASPIRVAWTIQHWKIVGRPAGVGFLSAAQLFEIILDGIDTDTFTCMPFSRDLCIGRRVCSSFWWIFWKHISFIKWRYGFHQASLGWCHTSLIFFVALPFERCTCFAEWCFKSLRRRCTGACIWGLNSTGSVPSMHFCMRKRQSECVGIIFRANVFGKWYHTNYIDSCALVFGDRGFGVQFPRATLGSNFLYPVTGKNLRLEGGKGHLNYTASSGWKVLPNDPPSLANMSL